MVFPDAFFEFPALKFYQQFQQEGLRENEVMGIYQVARNL
jgi:hypothetical protein